MAPVGGSSLPDDQRAGERRKTHRDGRQHNPDSGRGRRRRVVFHAAQIALCRNQIPPAVTGIDEPRTFTLVFDSWWFVDRGRHFATTPFYCETVRAMPRRAPTLLSRGTSA